LDKSDKIKVGVAVVLILAAVILIARMLLPPGPEPRIGPDGEEVERIQSPSFN